MKRQYTKIYDHKDYNRRFMAQQRSEAMLDEITEILRPVWNRLSHRAGIKKLKTNGK